MYVGNGKSYESDYVNAAADRCFHASQYAKPRKIESSGPQSPSNPRHLSTAVSLVSGEDLMQSLAQTQLLLQNVWAENYHDFGEFVPDNLAFNFPTTQDLFTRNMDLSRLQTPVVSNPNMPMKFPDVIGKTNN